MRGEFAAIAILRVLRRGGIYAARCSRPDITNYRVNRTKGFPLGGGKLSPQMTDEGLPTGSFPLIRRVPRHLPPRGKAFPAGDEVTPPYIAILPQSFLPRPYPINVRARRALRIYYLLFLIYYLNCPSPAKPHPPHISPGTLPRPKNAPPGRFCPAVRKTRGAGCSRPRWCTDPQHPGKLQ